MTAYVATRATVASHHAAHVLALGIPVLMLVVGLGWDSLRRRERRPRSVLPLSTPLLLAALAGLGAAAIHAGVAPEHFRESAWYGAFFVGTAAAQVAGATVLVARRSRTLTAAVAAGNALVILLWLVTRTVGIPFGPAAGTVEPFQRLDILASSFETLVVICCVAALHRVAGAVRSVPAL